MIFEIIILVVVTGVYKIWFQRLKNFPPGPKSIPVIGHLPILGKHPHKTLLELKKSYGPIIGVWFGSYPAMVLNDPNLIKEALHTNEFMDRPDFNFFADRNGGRAEGIVFTSGQKWVATRRFVKTSLRAFGYGNKSMEIKIQEEAAELVHVLKGKQGRPLLMKNIFSISIVNSIWTIMFGERKILDDPDLVEAVQRLNELINVVNCFYMNYSLAPSEPVFHDPRFRFVSDSSLVAELAIFMPWLAKAFPKLSGYNKMLQHYPAFYSFLDKQLDINMRTYVKDQPRGLVDAYEDDVRNAAQQDTGLSTYSPTCRHVVLDLFMAGTETTSTVLTFLFLYMVRWPNVQRKLQKEIDQVIGKGRIPSLNDRCSMHYLMAVLSETFRFCSLLPLLLFHSASQSTEFHGYSIPKGTVIVPNVYAVHNDPELWGDPQNFRPERFLSQDGKFQKSENILGFSAGRRVCIGESLARDQLFVFSSHLFQHFEVQPVPGKFPSLETIVGVVLLPVPFEIILKERV